MRDGDSMLIQGYGPDAVEAAHIVPQSRPDVRPSLEFPLD